MRMKYIFFLSKWSMREPRSVSISLPHSAAQGRAPGAADLSRTSKRAALLAQQAYQLVSLDG